MDQIGNQKKQFSNYASPFGMQTQLSQNLTSMQGNESLDNSFYANRLNASKEGDPRVKLVGALATWYGINKAMDKFTPTTGGEYTNSSFGKVGNFGDTVQNKFTSSKIGQFFMKGYNGVRNFWHKATGKSSVLYSISNTPTQAEWKFAKTPSAGLKGFLLSDIESVFKSFLTPASYAQQFEQFGYSTSQIEALENSLKSLPKADKAIALAKEELKALGVNQKTIDNIYNHQGIIGLNKHAKSLKVKRLGFKNLKEFETCLKDGLKNSEKILEALNNAVAKNPDANVTIWRNNKFKKKLFGRNVKLSELRNKLMVASNKGGKTKLGKFLTKGMGYFFEGTTNRFSGGKLGVFLQAFIYGDMIASTLVAPKGEKGKTFAERFVNDLTYIIATPIACMAMHKVGGMKYAGLDADGVKNYREALKAFNAKAKAGGFATKTEYKAAKKALNNMLKANTKWYTKIFKNIGRLINIGNETRAAYKSNAKYNLNFLRKIPNFLKNCAGVPTRFLLPVALITPFIVKLVTKGEHKIFGKPTHSVLDDEEAPKQEQELTPEQQQAMAQLLEQLKQQQASQNTPIENNSPSNLLNMYKSGNPYENPLRYPINEEIRTYIPSPEGIKVQSNNDDSEKTYIPSPHGAVINNNQDLSMAEIALKKADKMEKYTLDILSMK